MRKRVKGEREREKERDKKRRKGKERGGRGKRGKKRREKKEEGDDDNEEEKEMSEEEEKEQEDGNGNASWASKNAGMKARNENEGEVGMEAGACEEGTGTSLAKGKADDGMRHEQDKSMNGHKRAACHGDAEDFEKGHGHRNANGYASESERSGHGMHPSKLARIDERDTRGEANGYAHNGSQGSLESPDSSFSHVAASQGFVAPPDSR